MKTKAHLFLLGAILFSVSFVVSHPVKADGWTSHNLAKQLKLGRGNLAEQHNSLPRVRDIFEKNFKGDEKAAQTVFTDYIEASKNKAERRVWRGFLNREDNMELNLNDMDTMEQVDFFYQLNETYGARTTVPKLDEKINVQLVSGNTSEKSWTPSDTYKVDEATAKVLDQEIGRHYHIIEKGEEFSMPKDAKGLLKLSDEEQMNEQLQKQIVEATLEHYGNHIPQGTEIRLDTGELVSREEYIDEKIRPHLEQVVEHHPLPEDASYYRVLNQDSDLSKEQIYQAEEIYIQDADAAIQLFDTAAGIDEDRVSALLDSLNQSNECRL